MALSSEEREELRSAARSLLDTRCASARVREVIDSADGHDAALWAQIVELGWTSIHVPERFGGGGCDSGDLTVVLHELGRALAPTPFLASAVLATGAMREADEAVGRPYLEALAEGSIVGSVALANGAGSCDPDQLTVAWREAAGGVQLDGMSGLVLDADLADVIVVAARAEDGTPAAVAVVRSSAGVQIERTPSVDLTRRLFTVRLDGVSVPSDRMLCRPGEPAARLLDRVLALGVLGAAADAAGAAERTLEETAAYATERLQFGKPIGSFQGVKHHCANMAVDVEASRAAVRGAAAELDADVSPWSVTAGVTSSFVGPACSEVCGLAMRVHGGIGFTWEHDTHLRMKRVKLDELLFGTPAWHRRRLADAVFPARTG